MKTINKNKYIVANLAANEDVTPGNRLVRIGDEEFFVLTMFLRCRFINLKNKLCISLNNKTLEC